jgi:hypothetical protein
MWTKLASATAVLAFSASAALASNWMHVGKNTSGSVYEIDRETLTRSGNTVTVWVRVKYGTPGPNGTDSYTARRRVDCGERSFNDLQTTYMKAGNVTSTSGEEPKRLAAPDSIAEAVVKVACAQ